MSTSKIIATVTATLCCAWLAACASSGTSASPTPAAKPASAPATAAPAQPAQAEAEVASNLEKKFQDAAKSYKVVQKEGKTLYCKREKVIGSTLPTLVCMTEAQLRNQIETTEEQRKNMRNSAKCTMGPGCRS
jgi:Skp family chaperone for outer membrane proteins